MWDFSGGDLYMQFSPDIQQNIRNGLAQIDLGSTDSSYTHSNIDQTYFQLDFTKHFGGVIPTVNFGAKYRSGQVHRETGNTYWYSDPTTQTRYQSGDPNASSTQPDFFSSAPLGRIPSGFHANLFPAINFPAYLNYLNSTYGPQRLQRRLGSSAHRLWRPPGVERDGGQQGVETLPGLAVRSGTRMVFPAGLGAGLFRKNVSSFIVPLIIDASRPLDTSGVQGTAAAAAVSTPPGPIPPMFPAVALIQPYQTSANGTNAVSKAPSCTFSTPCPSGSGFRLTSPTTAPR